MVSVAGDRFWKPLKEDSKGLKRRNGTRRRRNANKAKVVSTKFTRPRRLATAHYDRLERPCNLRVITEEGEAGVPGHFTSLACLAILPVKTVRGQPDRLC